MSLNKTIDYISPDDIVKNELSLSDEKNVALSGNQTYYVLSKELNAGQRARLLVLLQNIIQDLNASLEDAISEPIINKRTISILNSQIKNSTVLSDISEINSILTEKIISQDPASGGLNYTIPNSTQSVLSNLGYQNELNYRMSIIATRNARIQANKTYIHTLCGYVDNIIHILQTIP